MKNLYKVTAVTARGYVAHLSFIVAASEKEARELVETYYITPGMQYATVRAEFVREE